MKGGEVYANKNRAVNLTVFFSIFPDQNRLRNEFVKQFTSKLRAFLFRGNPARVLFDGRRWSVSHQEEQDNPSCVFL